MTESSRTAPAADIDLLRRAFVELIANAIEHGIVLGPEDRKKQGLCTELSIRENVGLANLDRICGRWGVVNAKTEKSLAARAIADLRIKTPGAEQTAKNLSGGNQQKVVLAK